MSVLARRGTHELRTVTDHLGEHHQCSCLLFSMRAGNLVVQFEGGTPQVMPAPSIDTVLTRWTAHMDLLRLECSAPWRDRKKAWMNRSLITAVAVGITVTICLNGRAAGRVRPAPTTVTTNRAPAPAAPAVTVARQPAPAAPQAAAGRPPAPAAPPAVPMVREPAPAAPSDPGTAGGRQPAPAA